MDVPISIFPLASISAGVSILNEMEPQTWIITGSKGAGKTTFCRNLIRLYQYYDLNLGGVLSHAKFENGVKTGIVLEDLATGETKLLGSSTPDVDCFLKVGCWYFNEEVLVWGNHCLQTAAGSDVFIFDECGNLELMQGGGFSNGLDLVDQQRYKLGVVVVRPSLMEIAQRRWPQAKVVDVEGLRHD
ncbi:nucleoside-triphosphatase [bacterium]|nr:nucleoside-triphosphatase [bacterium]